MTESQGEGLHGGSAPSCPNGLAHDSTWRNSQPGTWASALLGLPTGGPSPTPDTIDIFSDPVIYGSVKFIGANDVGPIWTTVFPLVSIKPAKAVALIGGTFGTIDLTGDVLFDRLQRRLPAPLRSRCRTALVRLR